MLTDIDLRCGRDLDDEIGHGHLDIELDHVCDRVELNVDYLVW